MDAGVDGLQLATIDVKKKKRQRTGRVEGGEVK